MPREQKPLRPIQVDYLCDKCEQGYYRPVGRMLLSDPPQFPHACTQCGNEKTFWEKYPTIRYVDEGAILDLKNYREQMF